MVKVSKRRAIFGAGLLFFGVGVFTLITGCQSGDTDGGSARDGAGTGDQFVSDGGAGAKLEITFEHDELGVGDTMSFRVLAKDPQGAPLAFIRIFCESEKGIAIIEPSSGGVAFEHTGPDGGMSGVIGGLAPGSFIFECRAPEGFNLVARRTLKITGEVPEGFEGFPGAAGGNLGGGVLIDDTPDEDSVDGIVVESIQFFDGSTENVTAIDVVRDTDCDGDGTAEGGTDTEPFYLNNYSITVVNNTTSNIVLKSVRFAAGGGGTATQTLSVLVTAGNEGGSTFTGPFLESSSLSGGTQKKYAGTNDQVSLGTRNIRVIFTAETEAGETITFSGGRSVTFANVNNCPASSSSSTTTTTTT